MILSLKKWTAHHNQILYSLFYYCEKHKIDFRVNYSEDIPNNCALLNFNNTSCFLDYSDNSKLIKNNLTYDYYFKRSLLPNSNNYLIKPLNFQVNFSYKPISLIRKLPNEILKNVNSRTELVRAIDILSLFTNDSHQSKNINTIWRNTISDNNGKIIFMTRLWDPARNNCKDEKERRISQNNFRIEACRIINKNFKNSITGVYPDYFAQEVAKDILLAKKSTKKRNYLASLIQSDICIADDGLKDTPGWKIGEYAMLNKAIITTPIQTVVEDFHNGKNYISLNDRNDFKNLPDIINDLIKNKKYMSIKENNKEWSKKYLKPDSYIQNIIDNCN